MDDGGGGIASISNERPNNVRYLETSDENKDNNWGSALI